MSSTAIVIPMPVETKRLHSRRRPRQSCRCSCFRISRSRRCSSWPARCRRPATAGSHGSFSDARAGRAVLDRPGCLRPSGAAAVLPFRRGDQKPRVLHGRLPARGARRWAGRRGEPPVDGAWRLRRRTSLAETEYRREIEVTIEPFRGLLLGLYFVSVGAAINPALIIARPGLILGLAVALVAVKAPTFFGLGRALSLPSRAAAEMALLLGPGGEFGFVMISAALAGGLIDRALATTLVSAVAISMLVIPALARLGARIGRRPAATRGCEGAGDPAGQRGGPRHHRRLRPRRRAGRRHA